LGLKGLNTYITEPCVVHYLDSCTSLWLISSIQFF